MTRSKSSSAHTDPADPDTASPAAIEAAQLAALTSSIAEKNQLRAVKVAQKQEAQSRLAAAQALENSDAAATDRALFDKAALDQRFEAKQIQRSEIDIATLDHELAELEKEAGSLQWNLDYRAAEKRMNANAASLRATVERAAADIVDAIRDADQVDAELRRFLQAPPPEGCTRIVPLAVAAWYAPPVLIREAHVQELRHMESRPLDRGEVEVVTKRQIPAQFSRPREAPDLNDFSFPRRILQDLGIPLDWRTAKPGRVG